MVAPRVGLAALALLIGCTHRSPESIPTTTVRFAGRMVDLRPQLEGYPYSRFRADFEAGWLYFDRDGLERQQLRVALDAPELSAAQPVSPIDWNSRSRWAQRELGDGRLLYWADASNDERMAVYLYDPQTRVITPLTDAPYVYGFGLNPSRTRLATLPRRGQGPTQSCVETMGVDGAARIQVVCDTPALTLTWGEPAWAPDGRGLLVEVLQDGRRDRAGLAWVPFDAPSLRLITDPARGRTTARPLARWLDDQRFLFVADDSGVAQLGRYDLSTGRTRWLTDFRRTLTEALLLHSDARDVVLGVLHRPDGDWLVTVNPESGAELAREPVGGTASLRGDDGVGRALIELTSASTPLEVWMVTVDAGGQITRERLLAPAPELAAELQQCEVSRVEIPTFDLDPATGKPRRLHGLLYSPRRPLPNPAARVLAFYGGENVWQTDVQLFCEAGIATLSPAVRGSEGYGAAFYGLNDGDLGGDEIIDLFEAARWLVSEHGYAPQRVGVYGRSHGGYATLRALTFPAGTNGHPAEQIFPFAFGLADAGFSDILDFYQASNIPDWVLLEAGDPATEAEKLKDRSPLQHVDLLRAPVLLTHGERDQRVPVEGSRAFAQACDQLGKDCTLVVFPGQGHHIRGLANERQLYQARFDFLDRVLGARADEPPSPSGDLN